MDATIARMFTQVEGTLVGDKKFYKKTRKEETGGVIEGNGS